MRSRSSLGRRTIACLVAMFSLIAPIAAAEPASGLCKMDTTRGRVPSDFPLEACLGKEEMVLRNSLDLPVTLSLRGTAGPMRLVSPNQTLAATLTRMRFDDPNILMPGDLARIPIGSGEASVRIADTKAGGFYAQAVTITAFLPTGLAVGLYDATMEMIAGVADAMANYANCLPGKNWVQQFGCQTTLTWEVTYSMGKALVLGLAKGATKAVLAPANWAAFVATQPSQVAKILAGSRSIEVAAMATQGAAPSSKPTAPSPPFPSPAARPLGFRVTGSCTSSGGTLGSESSGFTAGAKYTVDVQKPDGAPYSGFATSGTVRSNGTVKWSWPCAGDASGIYKTRVADVATGRVTPWVAFEIGQVSVRPSSAATPTSAASPTSAATPTSAAVTAYDNYGTVTSPGIPMCTGNPSRPESLPGGSVSQTFTVPAGVNSIDSSLVQIDPNSGVKVEASIQVDGQVRARDTQSPTGDTNFSFSSVPVTPGQQVTLALTWSATQGKLNTVYLVGSPANSHVIISNSCSDGAPSVDRTDTGLRAIVRGRT